MGELVVGISDLKVSNNPADSMVTYALGSCIAVAVYDPAAKVGGLLHYMLPDSTLDAEKARETPGMFADTGIPLLFKSCYGIGADKRRMVVKVAGGASILDESNFFRIGQKNIMAMRKLFWRNNILIDAEDTGKNFNRTVRLDVGTGRVFIKRAGGPMEAL
ncbi:MAG: chemotaxis protein CheD [Pseudomonadota bacterium]|jgi:chemotaxis protein CheD|nr:chemotaxis protein CheD [Pseudomonadota bacterium]NLX32271.1 chemotaxis protein CheD [Deltaproteobacteria bacterium]HNU86603.1 chemotaxis protein CheD [Syntrophales bacterium]HOF73612.1 chemotaxis protein CheD [Syntrophales bacterium]HOT49324.1 chemotaxis protein CheD [Syntrophales bacterium]